MPKNNRRCPPMHTLGATAEQDDNLIPPCWSHLPHSLVPDDGREHLPTYLYHGTREIWLPSVLDHGLLSRPKGSHGNWPERPSEADFVYLSSAFAPIYALNLGAAGAHTPAVVVEVDTAHLRTACCFPDEDFLSQKYAELAEGATASERSVLTREYRQRVLWSQHLWTSSLKELGSLAYWRHVPRRAITRYAVIEQGKCPALCDLTTYPALNIASHRVVGDIYRSLTSFLFDGTPPKGLPLLSPSSLSQVTAPSMKAMIERQHRLDEYLEVLTRERSIGVRVITP